MCMIISVKSNWRPLTEILCCFYHFTVAVDETLLQAVIISLAIDCSYQTCCHSVLCVVCVWYILLWLLSEQSSVILCSIQMNTFIVITKLVLRSAPFKTYLLQLPWQETCGFLQCLYVMLGEYFKLCQNHSFNYFFYFIVHCFPVTWSWTSSSPVA
jgi:hypothetical protein